VKQCGCHQCQRQCMPPKLGHQAHCPPHAPEVAVVGPVVSEGVSVGTTSAVVDAVGVGRVIVIGSNDVGVGPAPISKSVYIRVRSDIVSSRTAQAPWAHNAECETCTQTRPETNESKAYRGQARAAAWSRPRYRTLRCKGR
jgi:hypothetical protein